MLVVMEIVAAIIGGLVVTYFIVDRMFSVPGYHGPITDHFNGRTFENLEPPKRKGFMNFLRWQLTSKRGHWNKWTDSQPGDLPPTRVNGKGLRVTFINHATVLLQTEGINILTDPILSERASPVSWAGPKRHRSPGLRFEDLPPIDFVLIGHNHYDHLDVNTLLKLSTDHKPRFVTGLGNREFLSTRGITDVTELDWWEAVKISDKLSIHCVPAKHFSGRSLSDGDTTLWCGYVIEASGENVYFAGDTGMGSHFAEIKNRFAPFRLALLPIGAYLPRWFMRPVHLSPDDAIKAHRILEPRVSMAIHFGTFALGDDGEFEPVLKLLEALNTEDEIRSRFWVLEQGEGRNVF